MMAGATPLQRLRSLVGEALVGLGAQAAVGEVRRVGVAHYRVVLVPADRPEEPVLLSLPTDLVEDLLDPPSNRARHELMARLKAALPQEPGSARAVPEATGGTPSVTGVTGQGAS